jgi:hypothetical protein
MTRQSNRSEEHQDKSDNDFESVVKRMLDMPPQPNVKDKQKQPEKEKSAIVDKR